MDLPFELHIALRYLLARRKQAFISLISFVSTLGVAVGVMALVVALALMTGLQGELRDRILGATAHVTLWKAGEGGVADYRTDVAKLATVPGVVGAAPAVYGKALVVTGSGEAFITIKGIDPVMERSVSDITRSLQSGSLAGLTDRAADEPDGILLGADLARALGVYVGESVTVLSPSGTLSPLGLIPRQRRFRVVGTFSVGLFEFDANYGVLALPVAERLLNRDRPDLLEMRVRDIYNAPRIADTITQQLGPQFLAQDWTETNRSLFSALWLEKMAISITIGLIVMVAALNIVASLVLLVMEKSRDIAILKAMGASSRSVMGIFMLEGLIIGLVGTSIGAASGYALAFVFDRYRLLRVPQDVYQVAHVPFVVQSLDFTLVVVLAILVCFVATIYPSRQASRLDPAQALRYQ